MTQTKVGWRAYVASGGGIDTDAQAFITAAGITNLTQASAINTLVTDLKGYGIWTKMKALYPMVGGSATSHKFNLKDPRDVDAAYRLVFNGGWTHTSTGALPNGTTGYADTKLIPNNILQLNSSHFSYYSRTNVLESSVEMMAYTSGQSMIDLYVKFTNGNMLSRIYNTTTSTTSVPSSLGLFLMNRPDANTIKQHRNSDIISSSTSTPAGTKPNINLYIGSGNNNGTTFGFSSKESAFASIGDGLSDTEAANFYTAVQKYQTTLGRQVGVPIVADTDAQAFLNAAVITDVTQANAINTLVNDLKTYGIWSKMKALYPMVGGSATSHKFNLKDPRDLDAAFRLVFNGGWTHSSTGAKPNGTTAYADTKLATRSHISSVDSLHLSFYSRTDVTSNGVDMGGGQTPVYYAGIYAKYNNNGTSGVISMLHDGGVFVANSSSSAAFYLATRNNNTQVGVFRNNLKLGLLNSRSIESEWNWYYRSNFILYERASIRINR